MAASLVPNMTWYLVWIQSLVTQQREHEALRKVAFMPLLPQLLDPSTLEKASTSLMDHDVVSLCWPQELAQVKPFRDMLKERYDCAQISAIKVVGRVCKGTTVHHHCTIPL